MTTSDAPLDPAAGFVDFFRALADGERLRVAASLVPAPLTITGVAEATGLPVSAVAVHLARLMAAGFVAVEGEGSAARHRWDEGRVRALAVQLGSPRLRALAGQTDERSKVLAAFLRDGRLTALPAAESRRRILLEYIADQFDPGRTYTEREVNALIAPLYDDYTTIRRALVDARLFYRSDGIYRRAAATDAAGQGTGDSR